MTKTEIEERKERVDDPSKCNLTFNDFNPPISCEYPKTPPPYWKPPERKTCPYLIFLDKSTPNFRWFRYECELPKHKLSKHPYTKTIVK